MVVVEGGAFTELAVPWLERLRCSLVLYDCVCSCADLIHLFEVRQLQHARALPRRQVGVCRESAQHPEDVGPPIAYEVLILAAARNQDVKIVHAPLLPSRG